MIDSLNVVLTSKNKDQSKIQKFERNGLSGFSFSDDKQFLLLIEEEKLKKENTHEHVTWIPSKDIIEMQVDIFKSPDPKPPVKPTPPTLSSKKELIKLGKKII